MNIIDDAKRAEQAEQALKRALEMLGDLEHDRNREREVWVRAVGRIDAGLPVDPPLPGTPAVVSDSLEALARLGREHAFMVAGLDAFNALLGNAATRAGEGRMVDVTANTAIRKSKGECAKCGAELRFIHLAETDEGDVRYFDVYANGPNEGMPHKC